VKSYHSSQSSVGVCVLRERTRTCTVISMAVATHIMRRYQHPKVSCGSRGMTHQNVSIFEPRTVCWQGNRDIHSQLIMNKHAHDSANGVCKAHVHTIPAKESISAPPTSHWTRRELAADRQSDGARRMTFAWYVLIVEPDHTRGLNDCASIISLLVETATREEKNLH
jgi:hypothetical protein